jgi:Carboxypeptidase regulatory-like domain
MTRKQMSKIDMYNAMLRFLLSYISIITVSPALNAAFNLFRGKLTTLNSIVGLQADILSGIKKGKQKLKRLLADQVAETAAQLFALASSNGDDILRDKTNFTARELERYPDVKFISVCKSIRQTALENIPNLVNYGVDDIAINTIDTLLLRFTSDAPAGRNAISERKTHGSNLVLEMKEIDYLFKNVLNKLVLKYRVTDPEFYKNYQVNRIIIDPRTIATQIAGSATSLLKNIGIIGVTVTATQGAIEHLVHTDENGEYSIKTPKVGSYTLTFSHPDFETVTIEVIVSLGKKTVMDVVMKGK